MYPPIPPPPSHPPPLALPPPPQSRMAKRHEHQQTPSPVLDEPVAARKREAVNLSTLMQLKQAFDAADDDGSGGLEMHEFVTAFLSVPSMGYQSEEQLMHLFMKIDANSDGTVDWDEFTNHMMLEQERQLATEEGAGTEVALPTPPAWTRPLATVQGGRREQLWGRRFKTRLRSNQGCTRG